MKKLPFVFFSTIFLSLIFSPVVFSRIGVGVGTGKIQVEDKLKPGMVYMLPSLTILNTGDESAEYEAAVTYHQDQPQLRPLEQWFDFSPKKFHLEPGGAQIVEIKLNLPIKIEPGDYFAYLEGHPLKKAEGGQTTVGVAAAAKLYFTVLPANVVLGAYYKAASLWKIYSPWSQRAAVLLVLFLAWALVKKRFKVQINVTKKRDF